MDSIPIKRAGEILKNCLDENKLFELHIYSDFFKSWKHLIGEKIACHSKIQDIKNKILIIEAEHPSWIQLIRIREASLLKNIKKKYPNLDIRGISVCLKEKSISREEKPIIEELPQDIPYQKEFYSPLPDHSEFKDLMERLKYAIKTKFKE